MKKVQLNIKEDFNSYIQVSQASEINWSLLSRVNKYEFQELHTPVTCREFLGDAAVVANLGIAYPLIYGLSLPKGVISANETLLSVNIKPQNFDNFKAHFKIIRKIERDMKIKRTKLLETQLPNKFVIIGDKKWMSSPLLISIYTLLIRSFTYETPVSSYKRHITKLLKHTYYSNDVEFFRFFKHCNFDLIHLLSNIDEVLGDNPLTGGNDAVLFENKGNILNCNSRIILPIGIESTYQKVVSFYMHHNHSSSGIKSLVDTLQCVYRDCDIHVNIGYLWAQNYNKILDKEKEL
jgi:hypothetical protein